MKINVCSVILCTLSMILYCTVPILQAADTDVPLWLNQMTDQKGRSCGGTEYCSRVDDLWVIPLPHDQVFVLIQKETTTWKIPRNRIVSSQNQYTYVCLEVDVIDEENNNEIVDCPPLAQPGKQEIITELYGCIICVLQGQRAPES